MVSLLGSRWFPLVAALVATVLGVPALWAGLQSDDVFHQALVRETPWATEYLGGQWDVFRFLDGDAERTRALMDVGFMPWWTVPEARFHFLRPLTVVTHLFDHYVLGNRPLLMHLHGLLWYGGVVVLAGLLYRRVHGACWIAGLATLLYAIDDAHAVPAGWLANRNGLVAVFFGVAVVLLHIRWRGSVGEGGAKSPRWGSILAGLLAPVALIAGLLGNEGAIGACAYVFAYAVFLDRGSWRTRLLSLLPYAVVVLAWRWYYDLGNYGTAASQLYIDPGSEPLRFLTEACIRAPIMLLAQWGFPPAMPFTFLPVPAQRGLWACAVIFLLWLVSGLAPLVRRDRIARFWALGMVLALVPACAAFPQDRLLMFVGLGAMGLLARFLATLFEKDTHEVGAWTQRRSVRGLLWTMVVLHLALAPVLYTGQLLLFDGLMRPMTRCLFETEFDDSIGEKTVVAVGTWNVFFTSYLPLAREMEGLPVPKRVRNLAPNAGVPIRTELRREDAHTLVVTPSIGFPYYLVRDDAHAFQPGDVVTLEGMRIEVREVVRRGWPKEVAFRFDVPLEDASLVWVVLEENQFVAFVPPAIGKTVTLNGP